MSGDSKLRGNIMLTFTKISLLTITSLVVIACSAQQQSKTKEKLGTTTQQLGQMATTATEIVLGTSSNNDNEVAGNSKSNDNPTFVEYDHSPKITGLPVSEAKPSPIKIRGLYINSTEQDFVDLLQSKGIKEGSCSVNSGRKYDDIFERVSTSSCGASVDGTIITVYYVDGRAKKIDYYDLGEIPVVEKAMRSRYGDPDEIVDLTGQGEDFLFEDGSISATLNSGDFTNYLVWDLKDTRAVLDRSSLHAIVDLYDIEFLEVIRLRIKEEEQEKIDTALD